MTRPSGVTATVSCEARSGTQVTAGTNTVLNLHFIASGVNLFNDQACDVEVYRVAMSSSAGIDLAYRPKFANCASQLFLGCGQIALSSRNAILDYTL